MNTFARSALLSLALATTGVVSGASAQNTVADWVRHMPLNGGRHFDTNRDGRADVIHYDTNRDGRVEAARADGNFDGYFDTVVLDTNRNGVYDQYILDTNRDGLLETAIVDSNHDGLLDRVGYDLNRTGYYSGWRHYPPPASSGVTITVGPPRHWTDALPLPDFRSRAAAPWLQPDPHRGGTAYDPNSPSDYGTANDSYRHSRRDAYGRLYSTGRR